MWFIGVEVEQETSAHTPKTNPGSAPVSTPNQIALGPARKPYGVGFLFTHEI